MATGGMNSGQFNQLNRVLIKIAQTLDKMDKHFDSAAGGASKVAKAMNSAATATNKLSKASSKAQKGLKGTTKGLSQIEKGARKAGKAMDDLRSKSQKTGDAMVDAFKQGASYGSDFSSKFKFGMEEVSKSSVGAGAAIGTLGMAFNIVTNAFKMSFSMMKGMTKLIIGLHKAFAQLTIAILAMPLKVLDTLSHLANEAAQAMVPFGEAHQQLVKDFGGSASVIEDALKSAGKAQAGAYKFLSPRRIQLMGEAAKDMGDVFFGIMDQFANSGKTVERLKRNLNIGSEGMKSFGDIALRTGKSFKAIEKELAVFGHAIYEATGVSQKQVAKDVLAMSADVANFGNITIENAAAIAGRMRTLGASFKEVGKLVNKFMNFDSAAQSAAKLGQAFGVNIDAMKMMKSANKDQGQMLEHLRKQFFRAGKDASKMNTAELRLLATSTGLSEEEARRLFSMKNRGKSLDDLRKKTKKHKTDQQKQTEAMRQLAKEMGKVVEVLTTGGLMENFMKGFGMGIKQGSGFLSVIQDINEAMLRFGEKVGKLFAELTGSGGFLNKIFGPLDQLDDKLDKLSDITTRPGGFFYEILNGNLKGAFEAISKNLTAAGFGAGFFQNYISQALEIGGEMIAGLVDNFVIPAIEAMINGLDAYLGNSKTYTSTQSAFSKYFKTMEKVIDKLLPRLMELGGKMIQALFTYVLRNPEKTIYPVLKVGFYTLGLGLIPIIPTLLFGPFLMMLPGFLAAGIGAGFKAAMRGGNLGRILSSAGKGFGAAFNKQYADMAKGATNATKAGNFFSRMMFRMNQFSLGFVKKIGGAGQALINFGSKAVTPATTRLSKFLAPLTNIVTRVTTAIGKIPFLGKVLGVFGKVVSPLVVAFQTLKGTVEGFFGAFMNADSFLEGVGGTITGFFKGVMDASDFLTFGVTGKIADFFSPSGDFAKDWANFDFGYIGETFEYMFTSWWDDGEGGGISNWYSNSKQWMSDSFTSMTQGIKDWWYNSPSWVEQFFTMLFGPEAFTGLASMAGHALKTIFPGFAKIASGISKWWSGSPYHSPNAPLGGIMHEVGADGMVALKNGMQGTMDLMKSIGPEVLQELGDSFKGVNIDDLQKTVTGLEIIGKMTDVFSNFSTNFGDGSNIKEIDLAKMKANLTKKLANIQGAMVLFTQFALQHFAVERYFDDSDKIGFAEAATKYRQKAFEAQVDAKGLRHQLSAEDMIVDPSTMADFESLLKGQSTGGGDYAFGVADKLRSHAATLTKSGMRGDEGAIAFNRASESLGSADIGSKMNTITGLMSKVTGAGGAIDKLATMKIPSPEDIRKNLAALATTMQAVIPGLVGIIELMAAPFGGEMTQQDEMAMALGMPTVSSLEPMMSNDQIAKASRFGNVVNSFVDSINKVDLGKMSKAASSTRKIKTNAATIAKNLKAVSKSLMEGGKLKAQVSGALSEVEQDILAMNQAVTDANEAHMLKLSAVINVKLHAGDTAKAILTSKYAVATFNKLHQGTAYKSATGHSTGLSSGGGGDGTG